GARLPHLAPRHWSEDRGGRTVVRPGPRRDPGRHARAPRRPSLGVDPGDDERRARRPVAARSGSRRPQDLVARGADPSGPRDLQGADAQMRAVPTQGPVPDGSAIPTRAWTTTFRSALDSERVRGIEPPFQAWEACVLPLNHTRAVRPR